MAAKDVVAGEQLDALIAETVFGYEVEWHVGHPFRIINHDENEWYEVLPYSTSMAAAWEIIETFSSYRVYWDADLKKHACELLNYKPYRQGYGNGDTPELAICRAALAAMSKGH